MTPCAKRDQTSAHPAQKAMAYLAKRGYFEVDLGLLTHLVSDHTTYWRGTIGDAQPDYIDFDRGYLQDDILAYAWEAHNREFAIIYDDGTFVIARRADLAD